MSQDNLEVFSKDTFLTSLRNGGGGGAGSENAQSHGKVVIEEPEACVLRFDVVREAPFKRNLNETDLALHFWYVRHVGWQSCETGMLSSTKSWGLYLTRYGGSS